MTDRLDMEAVIEAALFVAHDPVSRQRLVEIFSEREREQAAAALDAVVERFREKPGHGVIIDEVAGGLRLVTRPDLHGYLRRFFEIHSATKLSMPALETLAIVAYRQPITGPEIAELRNVSSAGVVKTLLERRLIRIAGRKEVVGKPFLYATTREFLMHFGLKSLKELPPLEKFEELFGDEAAPEGVPPDAEERADREAAEAADAESAAADEREREEIEDERAEAEDAEEPPAIEEPDRPPAVEDPPNEPPAVEDPPDEPPAVDEPPDEPPAVEEPPPAVDEPEGAQAEETPETDDGDGPDDEPAPEPVTAELEA
ncbi:MAG TPA: SMC-Scp complex subunit ScpB [Thermoanaerobaculia bacterium]|jgi:segregation and condensation protein B